jgi:hypothetical protein
MHCTAQARLLGVVLIAGHLAARPAPRADIVMSHTGIIPCRRDGANRAN